MLISLFLTALAFQSSSPSWREGTLAVEGTYGTYPPPALERLFPDSIPHQDEVGGAIQELAVLVGSEGGYAALMRDHRDGLAGLYLARLGPKAQRLGPEDVIHRPHAGRRLQPHLALGPDASGAGVWTMDILNVPVIFGRAFDAQGAWRGPDRALTPMPEQLQPGRARGQGPQIPRVAVRPEGGYWVAWTNRGGLFWLECNADMEPVGEPKPLGSRGLKIESSFEWIALGSAPLALWTAEGSTWLLRAGEQLQARSLGLGRLIKVSPRKDGAWLVLEHEGQFRLLHLDARGELEGPERRVGAAGEKVLDVAGLPGAAAVLIERGPLQWHVECHALSGSAAPQRFEFLPADARPKGTVALAASGRELLVAWTETGAGDGDPLAARIEALGAQAQVHAPMRLATDTASADQIGPRVATRGEAGLVTWTDRRSGSARCYARRLGRAGLVGSEWELPSEGASSLADAAVAADGSFAVAWSDERGVALLRYDAQGQRRGELRRISATPAREILLFSSRQGAHWRVFWSDAEHRLQTQALGAELESLGRAKELGNAQRPAACELLNGEWILVGDLRGEQSQLVGWRLSADMERQMELSFPATPSGHDWDPALAAARDGGFLMSWTSGPIDTPLRDVVARRFDAQGQPTAPLLWIGYTGNEQDTSELQPLADGSFVVAYEDDLSGYDHTLAQRIDAAGTRLGPLMLINELKTTHCEDRVAPRIAAWGRGFTAVFGDRHRSKGWDVSWTAFGPNFDGLAGQ